MFVLHPSSRCDVCLEAFSWEVEMAPYAIPCGHVFCKTCLDSVVPPKCPMCRKNFEPTRMKKLHVDKPEGADDPRELDLLQRVAVSFDGTEQLRMALMAEVDAYLTGKDEEVAKPLRAARIAMEKYREFKAMSIDGKRELSMMKREMREKERVVDAEKERTVAIEMNLIERARELQAFDGTDNDQLDAAKGEIEHLRAEIQRRTQLKNPLPAPPQPISLDRYAGFQGSSSQTQWYTDHNRPMYVPAGTHRSMPSNGTPYHRPRSLFPDEDQENQVLHESNGVKKERKGKGRDSEATNDLYRGYGAGPSRPRAKTAGIIPGASPKSKFIPPDPEAEVREKGYQAFAPPGSSRSLDPGGQGGDAYPTFSNVIPAHSRDGFPEGRPDGTQVAHRAIPSGSRGETEASASESDREKRDRREKRRQQREEKKARHEERERRRAREGQNGHASTSHRSHRSEDTSNTGEGQRSRSHHRPRTTAFDDDQQPQPDPPSQSRPAPSRPRSNTHHVPTPEIAQPVPTVPSQVVQETIETLDHTAEVMLTPASRRSVQTNGSVESWGTVNSLPAVTPNSFTSLNLRNLPAPVIPIPSETPPTNSPTRPPTISIVQTDEEESGSEGETETDEVVPTPTAPTHPPQTPRHRQRRSQTAAPPSTVPHSWAAPPVSAPAQAGSRHTHTLTILPTDHYQNPTLQPQPAIRSASAAVPDSSNSRQHHPQSSRTNNHRTRRESQPHTQHRSRHSASQVPHVQLTNSDGGRDAASSNSRSRRVSFTSAPPMHINPSSSSLSLHPPGGYLRTAAQELDAMNLNDAGYHTDIPSSGNALGLAISNIDRDYIAGTRGGPGVLIIAQPRPVVSNQAFLRSFSHENYHIVTQ